MRPKWIPFGVAQQNTTTSAASAHVDGTVAPTISSADSKEFGLENFGNTCYANSVLQTLYFCNPFRELLIQLPDPSIPQDPPFITSPPPSAEPQPSETLRPRKSERKFSITDGRAASETGVVPIPAAPPIPLSPPTLASALRSLFVHISKNPADKGTIAPRAFIEKLRQLNELFRSQMHQDAHEFLNYLLNRVVEEIEQERRHSGDYDSSTSSSSRPISSPVPVTLVHRLFEGVLTSETRCLTCETVSSRDESFIDLSIDIEQNSSVTACLRQFSASEMLCQKNKFFCDSCCDLQEAEKRMKIKKLPNVLALHLKRFKYQEELQKYIKLTYRVAFPIELRLFNTADDADDPDRLYELFGIVVHIGNGPHHGHYVSIIKANGSWKIFDDDTVDTIKESDIPKYFGDSNSGSAYVLYYQAVDLDLQALGLRSPSPPPKPATESLSDYLPIPALPPGLINETDFSDVAESSGPVTPAVSNPTYSPKIVGSPAPIKSNIPPSDLSLPKSSGGLFHALRQTASAIKPITGASDNRKSQPDAASMAASSSSSSSTAPPSNCDSSSSSKPTTRPVTTSRCAVCTNLPVTEPPLMPPSPKSKPTGGGRRWFRRKSFEKGKDQSKNQSKNQTKDQGKDNLTSSSDGSKGQDDQDGPSWVKTPGSPKVQTTPTNPSDCLMSPSPASTIDSASQRSASPPLLSQLPEPLIDGRPPPGKLRRLLGTRPSTAGATIARSSTSTPSLPTASGPSMEIPPLPQLPPLPASPVSPRTPVSAVHTPTRGRTASLDDETPMNETGHRKRPSSAHASVGHGPPQLLPFGSTDENALRRVDYQNSRGMSTLTLDSGGSQDSNWKRTTRKLSMTGAMLSFGKKHREKLASSPSVNKPPPSSFPPATTTKQ